MSGSDQGDDACARRDEPPSHARREAVDAEFGASPGASKETEA
jgi:hypothetical protein